MQYECSHCKVKRVAPLDKCPICGSEGTMVPASTAKNRLEAKVVEFTRARDAKVAREFAVKGRRLEFYDYEDQRDALLVAIATFLLETNK